MKTDNFNKKDVKKFAKEMADTIFLIHIEGTFLYENEELSKEFIEMIVDDYKHVKKIKKRIANLILKDIESGYITKLEYTSDLYDYGYEISEYCLEQKIKKKLIGFQVLEMETLDIHPNMDESSCVYNLSQSMKMIYKSISPNDWKLSSVFKNDIIKPIFMFTGKPTE